MAGKKTHPKTPTPPKKGKAGTAAAQGNFLELFYTQEVPKKALNTLNTEFWWYFVFRKTEVATNTCSPLTPKSRFCKTGIFYTQRCLRVKIGISRVEFSLGLPNFHKKDFISLLLGSPTLSMKTALVYLVNT